MNPTLQQRIFAAVGQKGTAPLPNSTASTFANTSESGRRPTPESQIKYLYRMMWVDPDLRQAIIDVRDMDKLDGRVRRIHSRIARDVVKGGLIMQQANGNETVSKLWDAFQRRLQLNRVEKLKSDARGLVMEGNLPIQWVLDADGNIVSGVRMPSETILPNVDAGGRFKDVSKAYIQYDVMTGTELASFPLWNLLLARFDPDNFDDMGSLGRPFLDASRTTWQKLRMTEEDLVIRRRMRAPLRLAHVLEGATPEQLKDYRNSVEKDQAEGITTDYYANKKGGVTPVQGDANLDQIGDIVHLLDTFFAGSPIPKGLAGYNKDMARDILEDLKRDYYDEVDVIQDTLSYAYEQGFRLELLLKGINPDDEDFTITFAERRTETLSQTADRGLKLKAMGLPQGMVWEEMGYDPAYVEKRRAWEVQNYSPYPDPNNIAAPKVSITPGNGRKGESGTSISNK
ncbi:MAG: hypothetical protein LLG15_07640 [Betaproteobacteria bacterium]|nr:hypothetical protein [Betaproteobacteria bacterium]